MPEGVFIEKKYYDDLKTNDEWIKPKIVSNAVELLELEIPKHKDKIKFVHLCFSTDPFMYGYKEISDLSIQLIDMLGKENIKCTALTKGVLPLELGRLSKRNEYGITMISLNEEYRKKHEPFSAPYKERIDSLYSLHKRGIKTWISIEPYPTPNIINQNFTEILDSISFVDKIIFGRLNYNSAVAKYHAHKGFYNELSRQVTEFCEKYHKEFHIKNGTVTEDAGKLTIIKDKEGTKAVNLFEYGVIPV